MNELKWLVCYTIAGGAYDDGKERECVSAAFRYPWQADDFIAKCTPEETRSRFYVKYLDD